MPTYKYECQDCKTNFESFLSIKDSDKQVACSACSSDRTLKVLVASNFNLVGDGWSGKNIKIKNQMMRRGEKAKVRQTEFHRDSGKVPTLVPNVGGERTETWGEAAKLARDKGLISGTYDSRVRKEANPA